MVDRQELIDLAQRAVSAVISLAEHTGKYPDLPTYQYEVFWLEPTGNGNSTGKREEREQPSYGILTQQIGDQINEHPDVQKFSSFADDFAGTEGKFFPAFGRMMLGTGLLLEEYFNRVGQLKLDDEILDQACTEYMDDLQSPTAVVRSVYWVKNFAAPSEFCLDLDNEIKFRPITERDIDIYGKVPSSPFVGKPLWLNSSDWICEIRQVSPKDTMEVINRQSEVIDQISVALNLAKEGDASFTLLEKSIESPFLYAGRVSNDQRISSSGVGGPMVLDESGVLNVVSIYDKVKRLSVESRYQHLRLPFRRVRDAASRQEQEDVLVDHVIGLESLLASDSDRLETTFRFRLRGAALLPDSFGDARERIKLMTDLYNLRSRVVHGDDAKQAVSEMLPIAENVLRTIFLWYIDHVDTLGNTKQIIRALDEAMVSVGQSWARSTHSD